MNYSSIIDNLTSLASQQTSRLDVVCVPPLHRRWLSVVSVCQLSATEPVWSLQLEFGTVCCSMSRLRHCMFAPATTATLDCTHHSYCCAWEVTLPLWDTLIVLVTYFVDESFEAILCSSIGLLTTELTTAHIHNTIQPRENTQKTHKKANFKTNKLIAGKKDTYTCVRLNHSFIHS